MEQDCEAAHLKHRRLYGGARPKPNAVADLLAAAGISGDYDLLPLAGGANNSVFRVRARGTRSVLKSYFRHPYDPRDRLKVEYSFLTFAWNCGLRSLPRPLACSFQHGLALYEFLDGWRPQPGEVTPAMVEQTLDFYVELNKWRHRSQADCLPRASEACAYIADHLRCVDRRIRRLGMIEPLSALDRDVAAFIREQLSSTWISVREAALERSHEIGLVVNAEIPSEDWCLSPCDFGFHNAIMQEDGRLCFIDFEYAGWDDPARMVCDFFCQQQVPVPMNHYDLVRDRVAVTVSDPLQYRRRVELLLPVYRIKWCCILLNDFLPEGSARRRFAGRKGDANEGKAEQLRKAHHVLSSVMC